jgi:hypothetical protein
MAEFREPKRGIGGFVSYLYLDGNQVVNSLSAVEGGYIDKITSKSVEEASKGLGITGELGVSGARAEGGASKDRKLSYEEEVVRERTGYSTTATLLRKLREDETLGQIAYYAPKHYDRMQEGDLYEFRASIRLHPFHSVAHVSQGWEDSRETYGGAQGDAFTRMIDNIENSLYGKNKPREAYVVFAEIDGSAPEYKITMAIKQEHLLVSSLDEFSGEATFVAQVWKKIPEGQKYQVAKLVRKTPMMSSADEDFMLKMVPILQNLPDVEDQGIEVSDADVILRKPAVVMKPLCIYKG